MATNISLFGKALAIFKNYCYYLYIVFLIIPIIITIIYFHIKNKNYLLLLSSSIIGANIHRQEKKHSNNFF